jgi:hypothetical protein
MVGGSSGLIQLSITQVDPSTLKVTYSQAVNVTYGCSATTFQNALNQFNTFNSYQISVVQNIYDINNNTLSNLTGAVQIDYVVSVYLLRPTSAQNQAFKVTYFNYTGTLTSSQLQTHSPLLSGTFTLTVAGVPIQVSGSPNIPYNVGTSTLQTALRTSPIVNFGWVEVYQSTVNGCGYSCTWIIEYKGFTQAVPSIVVSSALMSGGLTSSISAFTRRNYSSNVAIDPLDYRFLNTYSNSTNIQVTTNKIPAICNGSCAYTFYTYS